MQKKRKKIFKITSFIKKVYLNQKKQITIAICAIISVLVLWGGFSVLTNNYTTPLRTVEKFVNAEDYTLQELALRTEGGLAKKQVKKILKILRNSDYYLDFEEEIYDESISDYEDKLDDYGDNFKITCTIIAKEELTKSDLRDYRSNLQEYVYDLESIVDETEDYSASDWGELAEGLGLLKAEAKDLINAIQELADKYGRIEVTKGFVISYLTTITGDGLDEPLEEEYEIYVYKVNGRWIGEDFGIITEILNDVY